MVVRVDRDLNRVASMLEEAYVAMGETLMAG